MRILWLKSDVLLPLDKGGKLRTWHLMRHLAARHAVTYLSFADPGELAADGRSAAPEIVRGMREVADRIEVVPRRDPGKGSWRFLLDAALHLFDPLPYAVAKYRSRAFAKRLHALLEHERFDLLVCDFLFPAVNVPRALPCPAVLFTHNVESEIWRRHADTCTHPVGRRLYAIQQARMRRFEAGALGRFDAVLAVSDIDRDTFARIYPGALRGPVHVVPTGVDTAFFTPADSPAAGRTLVFTGSMDWLPNEDAMLYFCRDILPRVRAEEPEARLVVVGRSPTPAVRRLAADAGVTITGRVDDVRPFVREAAVYVVPLRIGGGTRLKIFEAMAMGKAVVTTSIGAEGLPVTPGEHVLVADSPEHFAGGIVRLLRDVDTRRALEANARALVVERYDWTAVAGELEAALRRTAGAAAGAVARPVGDSVVVTGLEPGVQAGES